MAATLEKPRFERLSDPKSWSNTEESDLLPGLLEKERNELLLVNPKDWPDSRHSRRIESETPIGAADPDLPIGTGSFLGKSKYRFVPEDIRVLDALREIREFATFKSNWDLEGALAIDPGAADLAAKLLLLVDLGARQCDCNWQEPLVGPDPDGGIDLVWKGEGRRVILMTRPGQPDTVECVIKGTSIKPVRTTLSIQDAVARVLWVLGRNV